MPKPRSVLMGILSPVTVWGATRRVGVFKHVNSVSRRVDDLVAGTGTITVTFDPIPDVDHAARALVADQFAHGLTAVYVAASRQVFISKKL